MNSAYLLKEWVQSLMLTPNLFTQLGFFYQRVILVEPEIPKIYEKLQTCVLKGTPK